MLTGLSLDKNGLRAKIISGSVVLLSGSTLAVAINLAYNVAVAHFLGPEGFGNANALYTLLTLISAVTLSFQIVTAKIVAQQASESGRDAAFRGLQRAGWIGGIVVALLLVAFDRRITTYLDLPARGLVTILAFGAAFYVPLGCRRGYIQGAFGFRKLATNLVLEGAARLAGSLIMVALGFGVEGVIVANSAAMAIAYLAITPKLSPLGQNPLSLERGFREVSHATIFFAGQVLINNCDIVLVKHFLPPAHAGLYAAIAMVGRVTFSCSSAIVNSMFPVVAGSKGEDRKNLSLIGTALLLVLGVGAVLTLGTWLTPSWVWTVLFGSSFQILGPHGFPYLMSLYAITTVIYCLSVVVMTYEMSYKIANTNWFQLLFSIFLIAGISKYHASLTQVILVQLVLMVCFLALVAIPFLIATFSNSKASEESGSRKLRLIRELSEDEVISGFLKSEFTKGEYSEHHALQGIVFHPDLDDKAECAARRALLYLRHGALWRELPSDTQWYEAEVSVAELDQVRVFPRAQWARTARGNFAIRKVADRIKRKPAEADAFVQKISEIRGALSTNQLQTGPVILIGLTESEPLTVLDGNHRFVAGVLEGQVERLKFVCGLSTNMTQCCWYKTNVFNLVRYARNLIKALREIPNPEALNFCESSGILPDKASTPPVL